VIAAAMIVLALVDLPQRPTPEPPPLIPPSPAPAPPHPRPDRDFHPTYTWQDYDHRGHQIHVAIRRADVAASIAEYGYSQEELDAVCLAVAREVGRRHGVKVGAKRRYGEVVGVHYSGRPEVGWERFKREVHQARDDAQAQYFRAHGITWDRETHALGIDFATTQRRNRPRLHPLARQLDEAARDAAYDRRQYLGLLLSLTQTLRYQRPPNEIDGRYTLGFYTPPQVAARAEGDCDSKSLFFATLWNGGAREVILVQVPKHIFLGVRGLHATSHKQTVVQVGGVDYLLCESTAKGWAPGEISEDCRRHLREGRATFLPLS
jgi:hypothetical protein